MAADFPESLTFTGLRPVEHVAMVRGRLLVVYDTKAMSTSLRTDRCERCGRNVGIQHAVSFFRYLRQEDAQVMWDEATAWQDEPTRFCLRADHWRQTTSCIVMNK